MIPVLVGVLHKRRLDIDLRIMQGSACCPAGAGQMPAPLPSRALHAVLRNCCTRLAELAVDCGRHHGILPWNCHKHCLQVVKSARYPEAR